MQPVDAQSRAAQADLITIGHDLVRAHRALQRMRIDGQYATPELAEAAHHTAEALGRVRALLGQARGTAPC